MGFRIIAGQLRFPSGNSETWLDTTIDLLGFRAIEESDWPKMSRFVLRDVRLIKFDVAQAIKPERHAPVRHHLERAKELTSSGEVRVSAELAEWRVRTRTADPDLLASFRYALSFCAGAHIPDAEGELLALEGRARGDREKRTFVLQIRDGNVGAWTPGRSLGRNVIKAIGANAQLPDLSAPPEARIR